MEHSLQWGPRESAGALVGSPPRPTEIPRNLHLNTAFLYRLFFKPWKGDRWFRETETKVTAAGFAEGGNG